MRLKEDSNKEHTEALHPCNCPGAEWRHFVCNALVDQEGSILSVLVALPISSRSLCASFSVGAQTDPRMGAGGYRRPGGTAWARHRPILRSRPAALLDSWPGGLGSN